MEVQSVSAKQSSMVSQLATQQVQQTQRERMASRPEQTQQQAAPQRASQADRVNISDAARQRLAQENGAAQNQRNSPVNAANQGNEVAQQQQQRVGASRSVAQAISAYNSNSMY